MNKEGRISLKPRVQGNFSGKSALEHNNKKNHFSQQFVYQSESLLYFKAIYTQSKCRKECPFQHSLYINVSFNIYFTYLYLTLSQIEILIYCFYLGIICFRAKAKEVGKADAYPVGKISISKQNPSHDSPELLNFSVYINWQIQGKKPVITVGL